MNNSDIDNFFNSDKTHSINAFAFVKGLEILDGIQISIENNRNPKVSQRFNRLNKHDKHRVLNLNFKYQYYADGCKISVVKDSKTNSYVIFYRYMDHSQKQDVTDFIEVKSVDDIVSAIVSEIIDNDNFIIEWPAIEAKAFYD